MKDVLRRTISEAKSAISKVNIMTLCLSITIIAFIYMYMYNVCALYSDRTR